MLDVMDIVLITVLTVCSSYVMYSYSKEPGTIVKWRFLIKRYKEIVGFSMLNTYRIFLDKKTNMFMYVGETEEGDIAEHTPISQLDQKDLSDLLVIRDDCYFIKSMIKPFRETVKRYLKQMEV